MTPEILFSKNDSAAAWTSVCRLTLVRTYFCCFTGESLVQDEDTSAHFRSVVNAVGKLPIHDECNNATFIDADLSRQAFQRQPGMVTVEKTSRSSPNSPPTSIVPQRISTMLI